MEKGAEEEMEACIRYNPNPINYTSHVEVTLCTWVTVSYLVGRVWQSRQEPYKRRVR